MEQPRRKIAPPRWLKPLNRVFMGLQRVGLGMKELEVLTVVGRRTGLPAEEARPVLRAFPALVPSGVEMMTRAGVVSSASPEEYERLAGRCAVFRIEVAG